jgi:arylformamidase
MTPEEVERGYNNRAAVPEHPEWLARWTARSHAAIETLRPARDVRYGSAPNETLDLYVPRSAVRGTLLFIHGGYWRSLDPSLFSHMARGLNGRGLAVAVMGYDLCPNITISDIIEQARRACVFLCRPACRSGGLPTINAAAR